MDCIYCNKPITNRRKGDHIIPQGLGKFLPEFTVFHICKDCDSKHGNKFERIALRTGILGTFRAVKGIKSRNNRKLPIHSPSLDKFSAIESQEFSIANISKPGKTIYVSGNGLVRSANRIDIKKNETLIDSIEIPPTRNIREICNFIEAKIPEKLDDIICELHICDEQINNVLDELKRKGRKLGETYHNKQETEHTIVKISSLFTENHFRFITSTVLKGMIFLKYSTNLLRPMIDYVKTGDPNNLIYHYVDENESGMDTLDDPPLKLFYHVFEWVINENSIAVVASILAHRNVKGIRIKLLFKIGKDNSIFIPYGKIVARYGNSTDDGILEIYHGDHKIEKVKN